MFASECEKLKNMATPHFSTIEDAFAHLETEGYKCKRNSDIANFFIPFKDIDELKMISHFEMIAFNSILITDENKIIEGGIKPIDNSGNKLSDIDINNLPENFFNRLKDRVVECKHPFLKAYYSHLLTIAKGEKNNYAQIAVNSYLQLIEIYKSDLSIENVDFKIYHAARNACMIAIKTGHFKEMAIKAVLENISFLYQKKSDWLNALIKYVVYDFKNFKNELTTFNLQEICFNSANSLIETNPIVKIYSEAIIFFNLGKIIEQKLSISTYNWQLEIAKVYEKMSIERQDLTNSFFCLQALDIYSILKMEDKVQETAQRYKQLIATRQLSETHQIIDVPTQIETFKTMRVELLTEDIKEILRLLSFSDKTMVSVSEIHRLASSQENNSNPFTQSLATSVLDTIGHIAQKFEGGSENYKNLEFYGVLLNIYYNSFLDILFNELIKNNILTVDILIDFLEQDTWFGEEITKMANGFSYEYKWMDFIKPALQNYFVEIDKMLKDVDYRPNFILFIDSLASKIEGIIRDIFELSGGVTFQTKGQDKTKTVEKDLNKLLEEDIVKTVINENDFTFLKFLMTDRGIGYNLRNDIAHTLMRYEDYNINIANLLLLALLRLSNCKPTEI